jgi:UDP-N-acetylmuramoyl-L-alanyl-D-glutamate--2,6-diaminopimelate ligase
VKAYEVLAMLSAQGVTLRGLSADSRSLRAGEGFAAYPGHNAKTDGRQFIGEAIARGAAAVLWERENFAWNDSWQVPNIGVAGLKPLVGAVSSEVYGKPSEHLFMAGVTGTNGKTSVTQWIAQALEHCGKPCASIGTLGASFHELNLETINTTPDAIVLQRTLRSMCDAGAAACAMEVSSIGLDQDRTAGVAFDCAVFTNFTRDHLDYHADMARYEAAKTKLFMQNGIAHAVINIDDPMGVRLMMKLDESVKRIAYCIEGKSAVAEIVEDEGRLTASAVTFNAQGARFTVTSDRGCAEISAPVWGEFNVSNLLAVMGVLMAADVPFDLAARAIGQLKPVPGRMNALGDAHDPLVVIDYAHTPDALAKALETLKPIAQSRGGALRVVFGCGGDRDPGKRQQMGAVAERLADTVMITNDNPRSEKPEAIFAAIEAGMHKPRLVVADRAVAITREITGAAASDVLLIAGKGHETTQEIAGIKLPFSDHDVARAALENRAGKFA